MLWFQKLFSIKCKHIHNRVCEIILPAVDNICKVHVGLFTLVRTYTKIKFYNSNLKALNKSKTIANMNVCQGFSVYCIYFSAMIFSTRLIQISEHLSSLQ